MQLLRLRQVDQNEFDGITEVAMDLHFARSRREEFYLVIGGMPAQRFGERQDYGPGPSPLAAYFLNSSIAS